MGCQLRGASKQYNTNKIKYKKLKKSVRTFWLKRIMMIIPSDLRQG